jgi:hypothetical protein
MENDITQIMIQKDEENFISHVNAIENMCCEYYIEDMGNESPEQEYLMYIEDHCKELREVIHKLYKAKLYIIKNNPQNNNIDFYRDKIGI